jgi:hypothetical protein
MAHRRMALAHQVLTGIVVVLVLVQAVLAGQFLIGETTISLHGTIANASFAVGLLAAVLALLARLPRWLVVLSLALLAALFVQVGLGYAGRTSLEAKSWHIPLGVTTFGLSIATLMGTLVRPR